ncbi:MAG: hypothetical protein Kow00105_02520 [Phycisphaeraceae bacterium]
MGVSVFYVVLLRFGQMLDCSGHPQMDADYGLSVLLLGSVIARTSADNGELFPVAQYFDDLAAGQQSGGSV